MVAHAKFSDGSTAEKVTLCPLHDPKLRTASHYEAGKKPLCFKGLVLCNLGHGAMRLAASIATGDYVLPAEHRLYIIRNGYPVIPALATERTRLATANTNDCYRKCQRDPSTAGFTVIDYVNNCIQLI